MQQLAIQLAIGPDARLRLARVNRQTLNGPGMQIDSHNKPGVIRSMALGILGLPLGAILWLFVGYGSALIVGSWKETELKLAQTVFVLVEIAVIVLLVMGSIRARQGRGFVVGVLISFTSAAVLFWSSWVPS